MENHSLLPQQFSFVKLPKEIKVLTDLGTGTILPGEKYDFTIEYRPSLSQHFDESNLFVRLITGEACVREIKIPFIANVTTCPIVSDKYKIEFPCLPEDEFNEVVLELSNKSAKSYTIEAVPPLNVVSGLTVNPLVQKIDGGKSTLVSIKYNSAFRDLDYYAMKDKVQPLLAPKNQDLLKGVKNKLLEKKIKEGSNADDGAAAADPKAKGGAAAKAPPPAAKKEDPKAAGKAVKKTQQ